MSFLSWLKRKADPWEYGTSGSCAERDLCVAAAEKHAELLERTQARLGLRDYVLRSSNPWGGLWAQLRPIVEAHQ